MRASANSSGVSLSGLTVAWVRWLTVLFPTAWGLFELAWIGSPLWGMIFLAAGAYAAWELFFQRKG